ncbi:fimbria/pilus outer membrane usher protein [Leptospira interrogans]
MKTCRSSVVERSAVAVLVAFFAITTAAAEPKRSIPRPTAGATMTEERKLFLEVVINGFSTRVIAAFEEAPNGGLTAKADDLTAAGLKPSDQARDAAGRIELDRLPDVSYRVDESAQKLFVETSDAARVPRVVDARRRRQAEIPEPRADYGAVLNYTLFAATGALQDREFGRLDSFSGSFDMRISSPHGTLSHSFVAGRAGDWLDDVVRLRTAWAYSDPLRMITYRAGDIISGGFSWTRSVNLGGAQVQRNFQLRPDLVTTPLPTFAGSAAVPSTIEVYTQNARSWSENVEPGPFEIVNLPVIGQSGETRVVLKDSQGRETVTSLPFFSSDKLLREGLLDFSMEAGLPRRGIGVESMDYDDNPFAILSARYGFSNRLTLEGHAEAATNLANAGVGAVFLLGHYGTASLAAAGSVHDGRVGGLASASATLRWNDWSLYGRIQRTIGDFNDAASVSAKSYRDDDTDNLRVAAFPTAIDQISLGVPTPFEDANLQLSYARIDSDIWRNSEIISANYAQEVWRNTVFRASLFQNLTGDRNLGIYAGASISLGDGISASAGYDHRADGSRFMADVMKTEKPENGSVGWRVRVMESNDPVRSAGVSYRAPIARFETTVTQYGDEVRATASAEGALVLAGGGVFATHRIYDSFAVVDVGAPDVEVSYQNRPVGVTDRWGRILVPNLHAYEPNAIAIDPSNLPVDARIPSTKEIVVPADGAGVVVDFGVLEDTRAALVAFVDANGQPLKTGAIGRIEGAKEEFVVGYGGEAFVEDLAPRNVVTIELTNGKTCRAEFGYQADPGAQVRIDGVVCL